MLLPVLLLTVRVQNDSEAATNYEHMIGICVRKIWAAGDRVYIRMARGRRARLLPPYDKKPAGRVARRCSWPTSLRSSWLHIPVAEVPGVTFRGMKVPPSSLSFLRLRYPCLKAPG